MPLRSYSFYPLFSFLLQKHRGRFWTQTEILNALKSMRSVPFLFLSLVSLSFFSDAAGRQLIPGRIQVTGGKSSEYFALRVTSVVLFSMQRSLQLTCQSRWRTIC